MRVILLFLSLVAFWVVLSGQHSIPFLSHSHSPFPYLLIVGVLCSALTTWVAVRMRIVDAEGFPFERIFSALRYLPWLYWQIVLSSVDVAKRVWSPSLRISPSMVTVPCDTKTTVGMVTYANSITLTPGTVSVFVQKGKILVHSISKEAEEKLLAGGMLKRVRRFEGQGE